MCNGTNVLPPVQHTDTNQCRKEKKTAVRRENYENLDFFFLKEEVVEVLVEHDGSAISVLNKHSNERHTDEYVIGVIVL